MSVFPHVLIRVTPRQFSDLGGLRCADLVRAAAAVEAANARAADAKHALLDALYAEIGTALQTRRARELIGLKRRIFNGRSLRDRDRSVLCTSARLAPLLRAWESALREVKATDDQYQQVHHAAIAHAVRAINVLGRGSNIPRALAIASPDLWEVLSKTGEDALLRDSKLSFGFARYVYRAYAKTSPFSWFTAVGHQRLSALDRACDRRQRPSDAVQIQPSGFILGHVWECARGFAGIRARMPTILNPTLRLQDGAYCWYSFTGNGEVLRESPATRELVELVATLTLGEPRSLDQMMLRAEALPWVSSFGTARLFSTLLQSEFLVQPYQARVTEPDWVRQLTNWFRNAGASVEIAPFVAALRRLSFLAETLGQVDADSRTDLLSEAQNLLNSLPRPAGAQENVEPGRELPKVRLPIPRGSYARREIFYENVARETPMDLPADDVHEVCASLEALAREAGFLDPNRITRWRLAEFVRNRYGTQCNIEFLRILEDLQEERRQRHEIDPSNRSWVLFGDSAVLRQQKERIALWCGSIADAVLSASSAGEDGIVSFDRAVLEKCRLPQHLWRVPDEPLSRSCTMQLGMAGRHPVWVLHHAEIGGGCGRSISRFLHLLPPEVTEDLERWNARIPHWARTAENVDGSLFSGNAHPPLTRWEVAVPGGMGGSPTSRQISLGALRVRAADPDGSDVELVDETGSSVHICDLGFQTRGRSAVFELLNAFSINSDVMLYALLERINTEWRRRKERSLDAPRIVLDGRIVLQRRRWLLAQPLQDRAGSHSSAGWYLDLRSWHRGAELPDRAFFRVPAAEGTPNAHQKPQYIDFQDVLSCEMLRRVAAAADRPVRIEEMYPSPEMLPTVSEGPQMVEVTVTWYTSARPRPES